MLTSFQKNKEVRVDVSCQGGIPHALLCDDTLDRHDEEAKTRLDEARATGGVVGSSP